MEELTTVCPKCGGTHFKVIPHPDRKDRITGATCLNCNYFLSPLAIVKKSENELGITTEPTKTP